jgi:hypothetical protein
MLRTNGQRYELLGQVDTNDVNSSFASVYQQLQAGQAESPSEGPIIGYDASGVAFYLLHMPPVERPRLRAAVNLQAEGMLPLPADQMATAWMAHAQVNGKVPVTLAAARLDPLHRFVQEVRDIEPSHIRLSNAGLARAWQMFYGGTDESAVVMYMGLRQTHLCYVQAGCLLQAACMDWGRSDLLEDGGFSTRCAEAIAHDLRGALERFGCSSDEKVPIVVISDDSDMIRQTVGYLQQSNLNVREARANLEQACVTGLSGSQQLYELLGPLSLALLHKEIDTTTLDLFAEVYVLPETERTGRRLPSWPAAAIIALMLLVTTWLVGLRSDQRQLVMIQKGVVQTDAFKQMEKGRNLREAIRASRRDPLDIMALLKIEGAESIQLDSFHYKKGRPVRISGHTKKKEDVYKYVELLQEQKGIDDVIQDSTVHDEKKKRFSFSITFHYKHWTRKKGK